MSSAEETLEAMAREADVEAGRVDGGSVGQAGGELAEKAGDMIAAKILGPIGIALQMYGMPSTGQIVAGPLGVEWARDCARYAQARGINLEASPGMALLMSSAILALALWASGSAELDDDKKEQAQ